MLLASHMLHEVEQVSDRVSIVRRGELITEGSVDDLLKRSGFIEVRVAPEEVQTAQAIIQRIPGVEQVSLDGKVLTAVAEAPIGVEINRALFAEGIIAGEISPRRSTLESLFLEMTEGSTV